MQQSSRDTLGPMTLAGALALRTDMASAQKTIVERLKANVLVAEGMVPVEAIQGLLDSYCRTSILLRDLVVAINVTNASTVVSAPSNLGSTNTISGILAERDRLSRLAGLLKESSRAAVGNKIASKRQVKYVPVMAVTGLRERASHASEQVLAIDCVLQKINRETDLLWGNLGCHFTLHDAEASEISIAEAVLLRAERRDEESNLLERIARSLVVQEGDL